ncbi:MAG: electron transport complex subunit RsxC [Xanthomonadales bacterium]|jgi:electron transport complex protein RnfC|nr:electron transport complex subunit RsxC [Xanthomonadales bacterium]
MSERNPAGEIRLHRFHGGLRLRHNKQVACRYPLERLPVPEQLIVPLLQHRGAPARCVVEPGQSVLRGQLLGDLPDAAGRGARVHAPTSGTVRAIETRAMAHLTGQAGPCVIIEADGEDRCAPAEGIADALNAAPAILRERLRETGVVGLGGAVFPTYNKVQGTVRDGVQGDGSIHTLILNGAECEPYIACDEMLMREQADRVLMGAELLRRAVGAQRVLIAIEDPMNRVEGALRDAAVPPGAVPAEIVLVPAIYPEGGERQLVQTLTGREVPEGGTPRDLGLLVQNVATAAAARDAILDGQPLIERIVTVTGNGVRDPRTVIARIGTPVARLIEAAGGYTDDVARLVVGGPMMGYALGNDGEPVVKATNCLLALSTDDVRPTQPEMPCIRCGDCATACPAQLLPQSLLFHARARQWDETEALGVNACIECGCCDFVCPSHIPLASWFRYAKGEVQARHRERAVAEAARERFEAREARLARAKAEKAERLARRKQKLKDDADRKQQIAAALARARNKAGSAGTDG